MRLTNYIRDQIINNVLAELPKGHSLKYYHDIVKPMVEEDAINQLPKAVRAIWKDRETRHFITTTYFYVQGLNLSVSIPYGLNAANCRVFTLSKKVSEEISEMVKKYTDMDTGQRVAVRKLNAALNSCQTVKTLKERYPELVKYFPSSLNPSKATAGVPMVQSPLADFKKMGLPLQGELNE